MDVRMLDSLDTSKTKTGALFTATLDSNLVANGVVVARKGTTVHGKVTKLASFGAFVQLQDDIDGLVHISQLSEEHVTKVKDVLKVGQEVEARVIKVDKAERRIGLSIKAAHYSDEELRRETEAFDSLRPGEDMVGLEQAFQAAEEEYRPSDRRK